MGVSAKDVKQLRDKTGVGMMDAKKALVAVDGDMDQAVDYLRENGLAKAAKKSDRIAAEGLTKVAVDGNKAVIVEINSETDFVAKNENFIDLLDIVAAALLKAQAETLEDAVSNIIVEGSDLGTFIQSRSAVIGEKISLRRFETFTKTDDQVFGTYSHQGGRIGVLTQIDGTSEELATHVAMHIGGMSPRFLDEESIPADVREHEKAVLTEQSLNEGKPASIVEKMIDGRMKKFYAEICLVDQKFLLDDSVTVGNHVENNGSKIVAFSRYEVGEGIEKKQENFAEEVANQMKK